MAQQQETYVPPFEYTSYVGVKFKHGTRAYFFGTNIEGLKVGDEVIVETARGKELGDVCIKPVCIDQYKSKMALKPILSYASDADKRAYEHNLKDAKIAFEICEKEIKNLGLQMNLISAEYTLDKSKIIISYLAEDRVDFRDLLKVLASRLRTRIELRQIGTRDKAKLIGGIGICGLPLCCSTFLNEFDGISINRAKNQMLSINVPKLSGHCGKLICCLKFEDDAYTEAKKDFPPLGERVYMDNKNFKVTSFNILSKTVKLEGEDDVEFISLEEYNKLNKVRHDGSVEFKKKLDDKVEPQVVKKTDVKPEKKSQSPKQDKKPFTPKTNDKKPVASKGDTKPHHSKNDHKNPKSRPAKKREEDKK